MTAMRTVSMTEFEDKLSDLVNGVLAQNAAASTGAWALLAGRRVTDIKIEVWSSDGDTAFILEFDDGSKFECPGAGEFSGPIADLVTMAGGRATTE
jgi:hypothetical protein